MMTKDCGDKRFPIWLLADSNPARWEAKLLAPLDPRHPVRHSIWTPVLDVMQDRVFRQLGTRIDTSSLYIRNAIEQASLKPALGVQGWSGKVQQEVEGLGKTLAQYRPTLLLSFGAFAFEFARRALNQEPKRPYGDWGAEALGREFSRRIDAFDMRTINALPLLHVSIARGKFIESHEYFCGHQKGANYFERIGVAIADQLVKHHGDLPVWIKR